MAAVVCDAGKITSWAGTGNSALISGGVRHSGATLTVSRDDIPATTFGSSAITFEEAITGLYQWDVSMEGQFNPATTGWGGLVSGTTYATNVKSWTMDIVCPEKDTTVFSSSGVTERTFAPGLISWSGQFVALFDDTTAQALPDLSTTSATFKIVEDGASDHTLAGTVRCTQLTAPMRVGEVIEVTYAYKGTGTLTAAGGSGSTWTSPIFAAGALTKPVTDELIFQGAASRTFTGDAFWTRVALSVGVADKITVNVNAKGTGALAIG